jgi:hypothetical protein
MAGIDTVKAYCGWHVAPSLSETVKVEGDGSRVLLLPSLHVTGVSEVRDEDNTVVTGWKVRENGVARGCWTPETLYSFDITHGYEEMPGEVAEIVADLDARSGSAGAFAQVGQVRYATGSDGAPIGGALTTAQKAVLDRYKLPPRP